METIKSYAVRAWDNPHDGGALNGMRWPLTEDGRAAAEDWGRGLMGRWTACVQVAVEKSEDEPNQGLAPVEAKKPGSPSHALGCATQETGSEVDCTCVPLRPTHRLTIRARGERRHVTGTLSEVRAAAAAEIRTWAKPRWVMVKGGLWFCDAIPNRPTITDSPSARIDALADD